MAVKKRKDNSKEVALLKDQLARALADYDNLKKRVERDQANLQTVAVGSVAMRIMPAIDMLEEAQSHLKDAGLAMAMTELADSLSAMGVEEVSPKKGDQFDAELCEAVESVSDSNMKDGQIVETILKGYKIEEHVLRHAKVKVAKNK